jgi:hypothetical protein
MIYSVMLKDAQQDLPDRIKNLSYKMSAERGKKVTQGAVLEMAVRMLEFRIKENQDEED